MTSTGAPLTYSVVIPCKNEAADIADCVGALAAQDPAPRQILVMDNGSTDGSQALASRHATVVDAAHVAGIGALRNAGAALVEPVDVVAFVDADVVVSPAWARGMLAGFGAGLDAVGERCAAPESDPWIARRWAVLEDARGGTLLWTQNLAVRSAVFADIGGFDETLATREDSDLSLRLIAGGYRVGREAGMAAVHRGFAPTVTAFVRRERWHTSTPEWLASMSLKSRMVVMGVAAWTLAGGAAAAGSVAARTPKPIVGWAALSAAGLPALGYVGGRSLRHSAQDGTLLAVWALARCSRLTPAELRGLLRR